MYTPTAFKETDVPAIQAQMGQVGLAMVVTHSEDGLCASHLPLLLRSDLGAFGTLYGHMARANTQWHALASGKEALVIFPGSDAYVSPSFYPGKTEHGRVVPTWNYLAVHAYGTAEIFTDATRLHQLVSDLTHKHESGRPMPWSIDDAPAEFINGMLKAIVGFALPIDRLEGKRKLGQNRNAEDYAGVRKGLAASYAPDERAIARLMGERNIP